MNKKLPDMSPITCTPQPHTVVFSVAVMVFCPDNLLQLPRQAAVLFADMKPIPYTQNRCWQSIASPAPVLLLPAACFQYMHDSVFCTDRICLINIPCLVMCQSAAFYMIGIISQLNLYLVIDSPLYLTCLFFF